MILTLFLLALPAAAQAQTVAKSPFDGETLVYSINWPSGLSLGEARTVASREGGQWHFELSLDAAVPGFAAKDDYRSTASAEFCSAELDRQFAHGTKSGEEKTTFDTQKGTATRVTVNPAGGGRTEMPIQGCARDALSFLYFLRRELGQGRIPGPQTVYFGGAYQVRLEYGGTQTVRANDRSYDTDRLRASFKGPASEMTFEMFFTRDAARAPVVIRIPFSLGTFSMELVQ
jgi:hypothetical protein